MLVDDQLGHQTEPGRQRDHVRAGRGAFIAESDHVLGHEAGPSGAAGNVETVLGETIAQQARHRRSAQDPRQAELLSAGKKDPIGRLQKFRPRGPLAVAPVAVREHLRLPRAEVAKRARIAFSGIGIP